MKVLFYTREFPPYVYGGAGVHVEYLADELSKLMEVVITSYSIHYTKLYDIKSNKSLIKHEIAQRTKHQLRRMPNLEFFIDDTLEYIVITSYSIHYTKLYEGDPDTQSMPMSYPCVILAILVLP